MIKNILVLLFVLIVSTEIKPQNKINVNIGGGYYLINSENSLNMIENSKYRFFLLYDLSYQNSNIFGYNLIFEYSYQKIEKKNIIQFVSSSQTGQYSFWGNASLISHNFDLDYIGNISRYFSYGVGPSFIIINRIFSIQYLYDKLASSGLGVNGFIDLNIPLSSGKNYIFFSSKLKFRYTHSIWYDKGIRNLDNYHQDFLTTQILAGVGFAF